MEANSYQKNLAKYAIGFIGSLILTFVAYFIVSESYLSDMSAMIAVGVLAFSQMVLQLIFFLHLGEEAKPRVKLYSFLGMGLILLIIVAGSLWIMAHLNYNMMDMSPAEKTEYMMHEKDGGF